MPQRYPLYRDSSQEVLKRAMLTQIRTFKTLLKPPVHLYCRTTHRTSVWKVINKVEKSGAKWKKMGIISYFYIR